MSKIDISLVSPEAASATFFLFLIIAKPALSASFLTYNSSGTNQELVFSLVIPEAAIKHKSCWGNDPARSLGED